MAVTYTTAAKLASLLQVDNFVTGSEPSGSQSVPVLEEVERFINWAEDEIDKRTGHAWRTVTVTDELYDIDEAYWDARQYRREIPLYLRHRKIGTFTSGTHKIEFWDGNSWVDLALAANGYTEGRGNDYWIDYEKGVIYFVNKRPLYRRQGVRVTYRYGESSVSLDIEMATTMLAAIFLLENDDYSVMLPEGTDGYPLRAKAEVWKKKVDEILNKRDELIWV